MSERSERSVPFRDQACAEFYSRVSCMLTLIPPLNKIINNNNVPQSWQHIPTSASEIEQWVTFPKDPSVTRLPIPRLCKLAGMLRVQTDELEELQSANPGARSAVALKLGEAMVVGALAEGVPYAQYTYDTVGSYIGVRVGGVDTCAVAGLWTPEDRRFIAAETTEKVHRVYLKYSDPETPVV
jgi:hypothetical protein